MIEKLKELMKQKAKEGKFVGDKEKSFKEELLNEIDSIIGEKGVGELKGLKKVVVASKDTEGLKEGLDKAKEVVDEMPEESASEDESEMMEDEDNMGAPEHMKQLMKMMAASKK